jgi:YnbE-like lipoprotein
MTTSARTRLMGISTLAFMALALAACSPTIKVEAPDKPIVINLNIKIEQEVRIRIDKDVNQAIEAKPGIF